MDVFDSTQWKTTKKLMSALGAWPFQPVIQQKTLGALFYFIIQSIYVVEILKLIVVWGNLTETLDCLPVFVYHSMVQVKMSNCLLNLKKAKILLSKVKRDWESNLDDSEIKILCNDGRIHKIIMDIYSSGLSSVAVIYTVVPLVPIFLDIVVPLNETRPKILPYPTEYFVDIENNFYALYTHGFIVTPIALFYFLAFDSLYAGLVQHACSMFTIVGRRLEKLTADQNIINIKRNSINEENGIKSLVICIKMHKEILRFAQLLEENYSNYFFLLLGTIVLGLTVTGFQFVVLATEFGEKIRCLWYGTGQIIHLFFLSYLGQKLIIHSEFINESICAAKWYNYPRKMKLLIILMLMRGKIVSTITAGKIYVMSVENFSSVMKTSMSYFTVLTSVQ
nr:olfactory receptor 162 [Microplitis mediator]